MPFSQTTRFSLWKIDTGTVDQTTGDKVKENTDIIDANLGKVMSDATDAEAGFLSQKTDGISLDVDTGTHKVYAKHGRLVHDMGADADYVLTAGQQRNPILSITDTGALLTVARNIIVPAENRIWWFENLTARSLLVKTAAGSGVTVPTGNRVLLACNGANVVALSASSTGGGGSGDMSKANYDPANINEQLLGVAATQAMSNKIIRYNDVVIAANATLAAAHESRYLYVNSASMITLTIAPNGTVNLPVGFECWPIKEGAGNIRLLPGTGVTLNGGNAALTISAAWAGAHLRQRAVNNWVVVGAA